MKKIFLSFLLLISMNVSALAADDNMKTVFENIDDLLTRVDSGISLNSFAETLAQLKIDYNKALNSESNIDNPLRSDRMKEVLGLLDEYAKLWKMQDIDHFKYSKSGDSRCYVELTRRTYGYDIACQKEYVMAEIRSKLDHAKSAHYNGW